MKEHVVAQNVTCSNCGVNSDLYPLGGSGLEFYFYCKKCNRILKYKPDVSALVNGGS